MTVLPSLSSDAFSSNGVDEDLGGANKTGRKRCD